MVSLAGVAAAQNADPYDEYDPTNAPLLLAQANQGRAATITVSAPYALSSVGVHTRAFSPGDWVFFVYNQTSSTLVYVTAPKAMPTGTMLRSSDRFAPVILQPGQTYSVGAASNVEAIYGVVNSGPNTIGVVTNQNPTRRVTGFPTPTDAGFAMQYRMQIVLNRVAQPVPTLSEWAIILMGLMLAGGATMMIQRRRITELSIRSTVGSGP